MLEFIPELDDMTLPQLQAYQALLLQQLAELDAEEPKNMNSDAYEAWGDTHEELEDLLDEILDRMDELQSK